MADCYDLTLQAYKDKFRSKDDFLQVKALFDTLKNMKMQGIDPTEFSAQEIQRIIRQKYNSAKHKANAIKTIKSQKDFMAQEGFTENIGQSIRTWVEGGGLGEGKMTNMGVIDEAEALHGITSYKLFASLEKLGMRDAIVNDKNFQIEVSKVQHELELQMHGKEHNVDVINKADENTKQAAKAFIIANERLRQYQVAAGVPIGRVTPYLFRTTHDRASIVSAGKEEWVSYIYERLDKSKSFQTAEVGEQLDYLRDTWDKINRRIYNEKDFGEGDEFITSVGKKPATDTRSRKLVFKDGAGKMEYNQKFGLYEDPLSAFYGSAEVIGRKTALYKRFGQDPEAGIRGMQQRAINDLRKRADAGDSKADKALKKQKWLSEEQMSRLIQSSDRWNPEPSAQTLKKMADGYRMITNMASLGRATIDTFGEPAKAIYWATNMTGDNPLKIASDFTQNTLAHLSGKDLTNGGAALSSMAQDMQIAMRMNDGSTLTPGKLEKMHSKFYKMTGLHQMTTMTQTAAASSISESVGREAHLEWESLRVDLKNTFQRYGINKAHWDVMRIGELNHRGNLSLSDDGILALPKEKLDAIISKHNLKTDAESLRIDAVLKMTTWLNDISRLSTTSPDEVTKRMLRFGLNPNSPQGIILRLGTMFGSYPIQASRNFQRALFKGTTAQSWTDAMFSDRFKKLNYSGGAALALTLIMTTAIQNQGKEIASGRSPKPIDIDFAKDAIINSGIGGILADKTFGDFGLLGQDGHIKKDLTILGPVGSDLNRFRRIYDTALNDNKSWKQVGDEAAKLIRSKIPYQNAWWGAAATDYLFRKGIHEELNPDAVERNYDNLLMNGQTQWFDESVNALKGE